MCSAVISGHLTLWLLFFLIPYRVQTFWLLGLGEWVNGKRGSRNVEVYSSWGAAAAGGWRGEAGVSGGKLVQEEMSRNA